MAETGADWTVVAEYTNHPMAELARNVLEENGIPVHLWADDCGGVAVGQTFIQRVRLFVPDDRLEEAQALLTSDHSV